MRTIWQHMQRDLMNPRKLGLLVVALSLGLLLWGRLLLKEIPRTATARPEQTAALKTSQTPTKSDPQWSDTQVRPAAVSARAADLELQDVIEGEPRRAVINGQTLAPGQMVKGFTVVKVAEDDVLLEGNNTVIHLKK